MKHRVRWPWRSMFVLAAALTTTAVLPTRASPATFPQATYAGTIGNAAAVIEFGEFRMWRTVYGAQYYYRAYGVGMNLAVTANPDGSFDFAEVHVRAAVGTPTGNRWHVRPSRDGFAGEWLGRDGRTLRVAFARIGASSGKRADGFLEADHDAYHRAVADDDVARVPLFRSHPAVVALGDRRYDVHGVEPADRETTPVARALRADFDAQRIDAFDCLTLVAVAGGEGGGQFKATTTATFSGPNAYSTRTRVVNYCGGVHPNDYVEALTVRTDGTAVDWKTAIADPKRAHALYVAGARALGNANCANSAKFSFELTYWLVPEGLMVRDSLAHVIAAYECDVLIPRATAVTLLRPADRSLLDP